MDSLGCCFVWFLVGALLGWLLNYWLCKRCCKKTKENIKDISAPPVAKASNVPVSYTHLTLPTIYSV